MRELLWSNTFRRAFRRTVKRQPNARSDIEATLRLLQTDTVIGKQHLQARPTPSER